MAQTSAPRRWYVHAGRRLGQHASGRSGANVCHEGGTHMAQSGASRRWHKLPTYVRIWMCHAIYTRMGQTGAARWCRQWRLCVPGKRRAAHTRRSMGRTYVRTVHTCATQLAQYWCSTQVAQMARVCATQVEEPFGANGARVCNASGNTHRAHWGNTPMVRTRIRTADWGSTQAAQTAHVCATQVVLTCRKLGQHAGCRNGPSVFQACGTHMGHMEAARRWREWRLCVPRR